MSLLYTNNENTYITRVNEQGEEKSAQVDLSSECEPDFRRASTGNHPIEGGNHQ